MTYILVPLESARTTEAVGPFPTYTAAADYARGARLVGTHRPMPLRAGHP